MTNNRNFMLIVTGIVALCKCLACVGVVLAADHYLPITRSAGPVEGTFTGHFTRGFEVAAFVPCADYSRVDGRDAIWWLSSTAESDFDQQFLEVIGPDTGEDITVYLVWHGTVSPAGEYGHRGAYTREATVEEVLEMNLE